MRRQATVVLLSAAALVGGAAPSPVTAAVEHRTTYRVFVAEARFTTYPQTGKPVAGKMYVDTWIRGVDMNNRQTGYAYRYLLVGKTRYYINDRHRWVLVSEKFGQTSRNVALVRDRLEAATMSGRIRFRTSTGERAARGPATTVTATFTAVGRPSISMGNSIDHTPGFPPTVLHEQMRVVDANVQANMRMPGTALLDQMFTLTSKSGCPPDV